MSGYQPLVMIDGVLIKKNDDKPGFLRVDDGNIGLCLELNPMIVSAIHNIKELELTEGQEVKPTKKK